MTLLYTHCPYCGFPVVVKKAELCMARRCRQCRGKYIPDRHVDPSGRSGRNHRATRPEKQRTVLQDRLERKRRAIR